MKQKLQTQAVLMAEQARAQAERKSLQEDNIALRDAHRQLSRETQATQAAQAQRIENLEEENSGLRKVKERLSKENEENFEKLKRLHGLEESQGKLQVTVEEQKVVISDLRSAVSKYSVENEKLKQKLSKWERSFLKLFQLFNTVLKLLGFTPVLSTKVSDLLGEAEKKVKQVEEGMESNNKKTETRKFGLFV